MLEDISKEPYSLIVDESTDISANKQLRNSLPLSAVDFGMKFQLEQSESKIEPQKAEDIKCRCRDYIFEFLKEIKQNLPPNIQQPLPFSNASVEHAFSQMALIKTKLRNRMQEKLLENILRVRAYMQRNKYCCNQFQPSKAMLSLFTGDIYEANNAEDGADSDELF
ncbi:UNVERIFIED_CONTAM: hypothetical protein FKN15_060697 [Acipenser sinensis]